MERRHGSPAPGPEPTPRVDEPAHPVQRLQQTAGNRAVHALVDVQRLADEPTTDAPQSSAPESAPEEAAVDPASKPMIRMGSQGPSVAEAQTLLNAHGATPPLAVDSIFGPLTRAATVAFQQSRGLDPDGIIGPLTWGELLDTPTPIVPGATILQLGDEGDDVGLLEQRLNAAGMAQPFLPIDATYDLGVFAAVFRFQIEVMGAFPTGSVDQATWDALEAAAPGGEADAAGNRTHVDSGTPDAKGEQVAGTSTHQIVGPGGLMSGPAVAEFQQKLNIVRMATGLPPIAETATFDPPTASATTEYQASVGLTPDGIGNLATWARLDQDAPVTTVGFVNYEWEQEQGGSPTGMTGAGASKYAWRIAGNQILVTVKVDFRNNPPSPDWFGFVTATWNTYKAVDTSGNEVMIDFEMVQGTGADAMVVDVKTGTGRANAGEWFLGDTDAANTIPHEYGHLIGLRDEYQVHPGDYREITGHEPPVGDTIGATDGAPPDQIARELQDAMKVHDDDAALAATAGRGVQIGAFAQRVVAEYARLPSVTVPAKPPPLPLAEYTTVRTDIAKDLVGTLPPTIEQYETIQVLTYSSGSLMGDPSRVTDPHDHGVQPRHVQEFCDLVAAARGGSWRVVAR